MVIRRGTQRRRGAILVFLALGMVTLVGFVALAIDIGVVAVARSQCQNAADAGAMAGTRSLNGVTTDPLNPNNKNAAGQNALDAATANYVLTSKVTNSQVTVDLGSYSYDTTLKKFVPKLGSDKPAGDNYTLTKVTVSVPIPAFFSRIFGVQTMNPTATSIAAHRPRDISIILDFSGSMRFDSLIGIPFNGPRTKSNNKESVFPLFGHYSDTANVNGPNLQNTAAKTTIGSDTYGSANFTVETDAGPPIVNDFYKHTAGSAVQLAFTPATDSYKDTPGGDNFLRVNNAAGQPYAKTINELTGSTGRHANFEANGYQYFTGAPFNKYTEGPRYWGKTFFVWPPDPLTTNDWRRQFFFKSDGITPCDDNTLLWDSAGNWRAPRTSSTNSYRINYNAILNWIKNTGTNAFPNKLRSGRILYYDSIPSTIDTTTFPPTDLNQRFWKDYIDYVLGLQQDSLGGTNQPIYQIVTGYTGYGGDWTWGTPQISAKPVSPDTRYMNYNDNPKRPRMHFWFGPMSMIDFLGNYNMSAVGTDAYASPSYNPQYRKHWWWPGTCHESPTWALKVGIQSSLKDIEYNHPNDMVALMMFCVPLQNGGNGAYNAGYERFNRVRSPLSRNYNRMIDSLWYPTSTIDNANTEIRPYDYTAFLETPHAEGGTCPVIGFMQTYNQYSNHSSLATWAPAPAPTGEAGGLGRKGAQKLIILETDGMANVDVSANFNNSGAYNSYYSVRYPGETPNNSSATVTTQCYAIVDQLCALDSAAAPGYATTRKPVLVHCIAFGQLFDPEPSGQAPSTAKTDALSFLQTIQFKGKTQASATDPLTSNKIIVGTSDERITKLQQVFSSIMQDGVQVTLIQ